MDTTIKIIIEENTSKLQAVKLIKAITKKGLKEAKEDFDAFLKENGMNTSWKSDHCLFKPGKKAVFEINYKVMNGDFDHIDNVIKDYEIWKSNLSNDYKMPKTNLHNIRQEWRGNRIKIILD